LIDIEEAEEESANVIKGIIGLGGLISDIIEIKNCSYKKFAEIFREIAAGINRKW